MNLTFEAALKRLAEKEPEKFLTWQGTNGVYMRTFDGKLTQDDIDEILRLIGFSYWIEPSEDVLFHWIFGVYDNEDGDDCVDPGTTVYTTKLEAAKAALIAVVERQYPELSPLEGR